VGPWRLRSASDAPARSSSHHSCRHGLPLGQEHPRDGQLARSVAASDTREGSEGALTRLTRRHRRRHGQGDGQPRCQRHRQLYVAGREMRGRCDPDIGRTDSSSSGEADKLVAEINAGKGGKAVAVQGDLSTAEGPAQLAKDSIKALGKIDSFIANAGVMPRGGGPDFKVRSSLAPHLSRGLTPGPQLETYDQVMNLNVRAPLRTEAPATAGQPLDRPVAQSSRRPCRRRWARGPPSSSSALA
jgi:hypothetical protein